MDILFLVWKKIKIAGAKFANFFKEIELYITVVNLLAVLVLIPLQGKMTREHQLAVSCRSDSAV